MKNIVFFLVKSGLKRTMVLNSVKLNIDKLHYHDDELKKLISGKYEMGENAIMKNTMTSDDVVLELGSGLGYNSIFANKVIGSQVHSYEANPELIPIIEKNVALNNATLNLYNKVIVVNPTQEFISFNVANHYTGSSTLPLDPQTTLKKAYEIETCDMKEVLASHKPTYLMCDIEGGEKDLFIDCSYLKESTVNKILIEFHPRVLGELFTHQLISNIIAQGFTLAFDKYPKKYCFFYRN
jgi:FkbM family methyltransferase